jgi:putative restriction endonuclease
LWSKIQSILLSSGASKQYEVHDEDSSVRPEYLVKGRLGQGAFRILVTDAYKRRCAITGERTLPVLEAAHIKPYARSGPNLVKNGLLLRSDLHKLFDIGYITVTPDFRVEVSPRIKEEYDNGKEYYAQHGQRLLVLPELTGDEPSKEFLEWHNQNRYVS